MNKSENTDKNWEAPMRLGCVGDWTVLESWSHVIGIMLRAVDEIVRIRVLFLFVGFDLDKLQ